MSDRDAPPAYLYEEEVCPSCGKFAVLDEINGWCEECSPATLAKAVNRLESYLAKNADEIEHYVAQGLQVYQAIDRLHAPRSRPTCIVCGESIKRASRSSIFCRRTTACRKFARRYIYLYRDKGLSKAEALAKIFEELS
jgi:hypothetical protein